MVLDPRWQPLQDFGHYDALDDAERHALAARMATALGPEFTALPALLGARRLAAVGYQPKTRRKLKPSTAFAIVPGGTFEMGVRPTERDVLVETITGSSTRPVEADVDALLAVAAPLHEVTVAPFLFAVDVLVIEQAQRLSAALAAIPVKPGRRFRHPLHPVELLPAEAGAVMAGAPHGLRLPCEAEWEFVAREGGHRSWIQHPGEWLSFTLHDGKNAFGVSIVAACGEWVADGWTDNHEGAPKHAVARNPGPEPGVGRGPHAGWQEPLEAVVTAAGFRERASALTYRWLRFARDLP